VARIVLDASALLAAIYRENGGKRVAALLAGPESTVLISALNWSETLDRLLRDGVGMDDAEELLGGLAIEVVAFDLEQAKTAAALRLVAPELSLADRACIGLASMRKGIAWTTDKAWMRQPIHVPLEVLR
jgi:ribonuclease VapC